jgi:hypothetical protein
MLPEIPDRITLLNWSPTHMNGQISCYLMLLVNCDGIGFNGLDATLLACVGPCENSFLKNWWVHTCSCFHSTKYKLVREVTQDHALIHKRRACIGV